MKVRLAYGRGGLETDFPDEAVVVAPEHREAAADQLAVLRRALREPVAGPPLREQVRPGQTVAISACDGTRPQPRQLMIPAVLDELDGIVRPDDVTVLVATGTHRARGGVLEEACTVSGMRAAVTLRHEHLNGVVDQFRSMVAKEGFGLRIHQRDVTLAVGHEHRAGRSFDNQTEAFLGTLALSDIAHRDDCC